MQWGEEVTDEIGRWQALLWYGVPIAMVVQIPESAPSTVAAVKAKELGVFQSWPDARQAVLRYFNAGVLAELKTEN